ncbi:MAG: cytochrome ubiquinol oxidase subunit I [Rikenellaceae bacterium]
MENIDLIDWSRAQFALTAMYHWIFVPLTLGLGFICAFMESIYFRTKEEKWKTITKFWMRLFAINFAIGVATGIILEFEFGTNWSNYSYFVGDIFGAPLAIEGIFAFFMESTFFAVMFFGWNRVTPRFHLVSTWLTALGANISALWILVANSWMQYPMGSDFNVETARFEMTSFLETISTEVVFYKFTHTVSSGFLLASGFVVGISAWYLIKKRHEDLAIKSMKLGSIVGLISALVVSWTGDGSGRYVAKYQPMKFAAMEALYEGGEGLPLTVIGILDSEKEAGDGKEVCHWDIELPGMLSTLAQQDFVAGIDDLVFGNESADILSASQKMERGKIAIGKIKEYHEAQKEGDSATMTTVKNLFDKNSSEGKKFLDENFKYLGYGYLNSPTDIIPNIPLNFYSFRIMVGVGCYLIAMFAMLLFLLYKKDIKRYSLILWVVVLSIPFPYIAGQAGWIVTEVGRQPWAIQEILPVSVSVSAISSNSVKTTFFIFAILFTILLIAEVRIMLKQIDKGMEEKHDEINQQ